MANSASTSNTITGEGSNRSTKAGDIPDDLMRRYYLDGRGGPGLGFYADARIKTPAFRDRGGALVAARSDPKAIRDMTAVACHRGWSTVVVKGAVNFRREAWLAGKSRGIEVRGYKATERDLQDLDRRQTRRGGRSEKNILNHAPEGSLKQGTGRLDPAAHANLRVIEEVVRSRVAPASQERILAAARQRMFNWLERGARLQPLEVQRRDVSDHLNSRPRSRSR